MKTLIVNILVALSLIIILDVTTYFFLPDYYVVMFTDYRQSPPPGVGGLDTYSNGYFVANEERGFDNGRNKKGHVWFEGDTYPIWSNSVGCYDYEHTGGNPYIYFAGDSFTWGYTPFDQKFGTVVERTTGAEIFKCGVTHTGQAHQFEKFTEVVKQIGRQPKAIFVFYYVNDMANDYAYPHSTVIRGWLVNTASIDENNELIRYTHQELNQKVEDKLGMLDKLQEDEEQSGWWTKTKRTLKYYSLSVNILDYLKDSAATLMSKSTPFGKSMSASEHARSFYSLPREKNGRYWYLDNPWSTPNKAALLNFRKYSTENNTDFAVVLIPPHEHATDMNWYKELRTFLRENEIKYIDLTQEFKDKGLKSRDLYWVHNRHLNLLGNKIVADVLIDEFPDIFTTPAQD